MGEYSIQEKLSLWSKEIYENATAHGWHEEKHSSSHYLGLVVTEVAEAIEADRNGRMANSVQMADVMRVQAESETGLCDQWYETWFQLYYNEYIKGSLEEEFADIVIRILDMAYALHGPMDRMGISPWIGHIGRNSSVVENAWYFVKKNLNHDTFSIFDSIDFMFAWADTLDIDLEQHIEWKMKYNKLRPYKHGGKKY